MNATPFWIQCPSCGFVEIDPWQPIKTVPKDGTLVDLWVEWPAGTPNAPAAERLPDCRWVGGWMQKDSTAYDTFEYLDTEGDRPKPTHWMARPEPPKE